MRIFNIIQCSNLGGMEKSTIITLSLLHEHGYEVYMQSLNPVGDLLHIAEQKGITLNGMKYKGLWGLLNVPELLRTIRGEKPDIIWVTGHNIGALIASKWSGVPTFLSIHYHHSDRPLFLWRIFYGLAKVCVKKIRFVSVFIYNEIAPLLNGWEQNVACFPNVFVKPDNMPDKKNARLLLGLPCDAFIIGNAGWLVHRKAFDVFLRTASAVKKRIPTAFFVIAGDGEKRNELEHLAHTLGLSDSVVFLGWQKDLFSFYSSIDVLLFNARYDAAPRTPLEALAAGVPVVASLEVGGLSEFIRHGIDGFLIDKHDVTRLANEIIRIYNDPIYGSRVAQSGRDRVLSMCSLDSHLKNIELFLGL